MKLKKNISLETIYETLINVALQDIPLYKIEGYIDENFMGYGSADDEKIYGFEGFKWMVERQRKELGERNIELKRHPIHKVTHADHKSALIVEEIEIVDRDNSDLATFVLRLSTNLNVIDNHWKISHFHGSIADANTPESQAWPIEELKRKKLELEQLVTQKTADLLEKNLELEIEAALERVRARSMAMQHPDELNQVLSLLFDQFNILGINPVWAHLSLVDIEKNTFTYRMSRSDKNDLLAGQVVDLDARPEWQDTAAALKAGDPKTVSCLHFPPEVLPELWELFDDSFSSLKEGSEIKMENFPDGLYNTQGYCKYGYIGFNHHRPATEKEKEIVLRFATEFSRIYQRFLDLKKAEEQAREAQIEASLERVRARSMAMQSSDELSDVLAVLFRQFDILGIKPINAWLSLFDVENNTFTYRATGTGGKRIQKHQVIDLDAMDIWQEALEQWKSGNPQEVLVTYYPPEIMPRLMEVFEETFMAMPEEERFNPDDFPEGGYNVQGYCKFGYIGYNHTREPTEEEKDILRKFAKEFGRVYQRFLDIQKAEDQAREAQIEAALERVRSRSLAMHSSEELNDVLSVLFHQIEVLGIDAKCAHLTLMDLDNNRFSFRITGRNGAKNIGEQIIDLDAMDAWKDTVEKWKSNEPHSYQCLVYPPEVLPSLFELINESLMSLPAKERIRIKDFPDGLFDCEGHTKFGYIGFNNSRPPTEEEINIVVRFAKEFERIYQRFLDLKKAEAQARENQIQLALERVRARSLAMHKSSEMQQVANAIYEQMKELGLQMDAVGMSGVIEAHSDYEVWVGGSEFDAPLQIPYTDSTQVQREYNAIIESRPELFTKTYSGEIKKEYIEFLLQQNEFPEELESLMIESEAFTTSISFSKNSSIQIATYSDQPYTEEENEILIRFCRVFEQAYVRFMDLKKAEKQAREAQVEAALERVRARSMGMQHSDELHDVLSVLFEQFDILGIEPVNVFLSLFSREDGTLTYRATGTGGSRTQGQQVVSLNSLDVWKELFEKWKSDNSDSVEVIYYEKEILPTLFGLLDETFAAMPEEERLTVDHFPDGGYTAHGYTPFGYIGYNHTRKPTEEEKEILTKFASEFSRVYQRFLDIEKAEAQARESEIQLALEKVRARSMAMHNSDELTDLLSVLFEQFDNLGIKPLFAHLTLFDQEDDSFSFRMTGLEGQRVLVEHIMSITEMDAWQNAYQQWKDGEENTISCIDYPPDVLPALFEIMGPIFDALPEGSEMQVEDFPDGIYTTQANCQYGYLGFNHKRRATEEEKEIVIRFAKEFARAYQRFLDIKQAEAQARESEIQLALERVRARTMAMHNSRELGEVAAVLFEQISLLTSTPDRFNIAIANEANKSFDIFITDQTGTKIQNKFTAEADKSPVIAEVFDCWKNNEKYIIQDIHDEKLENWIRYMGDVVGVPFNMKNVKKHRFLSSVFFSHGFIGITTHSLPSDTTIDLIERFANVFQQTYTRFLDLQKAEAQAREAKIEAAIEKVRSRSLAMHETNEMQQVVNAVYEQLQALGIEIDIAGMSGVIESKSDYVVWGSHFSEPLLIPFNDDTQLQREYNQAIEKRPRLFTKTFTGQVKKEYIDHLLSHAEIPPDLRKLMIETKAKTTSISFSKYSSLQIVRYTDQPYSNQENEILVRFAKVFEQAYVRFMDLQKAEERAREAEIEAALEAVRSRSLAMHATDELQDVVKVVAEKVQELGLVVDSGGVIICTYPPDSKDVIHWTYTPDEERSVPYFMPYFESAIWDDAWESKNNEDDYFSKVYKGDDKNTFLKTIFTHPESDYRHLPEDYKKSVLDAEKYGLSFAWAENTALLVPNIEGHLLPEGHKKILIRFSNVLEQAYVRFMDLKKSEEQARESEIQLALERVRARTMAMQNSEELAETSAVLFEQMKMLGVTPERMNVCLVKEDSKELEVWSTDQDGVKINHRFTASFDEATTGKKAYEAWKKGVKSTSITLTGDELSEWIKYVREEMNMDIREERIKDQRIHSLASFSHGMLITTTSEPLPPESIRLMERFAEVFNLTYTRFLDLQKAEEQAREAEIEASLERVRAKGLSMHSTEDIESATAVVFNELSRLGIDMERCGITIMNETPIAELWSTTLSQETKEVIDIVTGYLDFRIHPLTQKSYQDWKRKKKFSTYYLVGDELQKYYDKLEKQPEYKFPKVANYPDQQVLHSFFFNEGAIFVYTTTELSAEAKKIVHRFTNVFEQTYTRFLDLQKAEKLATESSRQASLDRIRAEIGSMRSSKDLQQITPLIWDELKTLEIPFIRCGVFIMDEENGLSHTYLSTAHGDSIAALHLPIDDIPLIMNVVSSWKKRKKYTEHWDLEDFQKWTQNLIDGGFITSKKKYEAGSAPETLDLHFLPFKHGMLYIGNTEPLTQEKLDLGQSMADAFSVAYDRYEDFNRLEQAKKKIEEAFRELEAAKDQLVQQEKLASLGQLTAGIAHEIKNPLNFINNFSDLSVELIKEIRDELQTTDGNKEALIEIISDLLDDVETNLNTIYKHGSRADTIVKSMLEHSRGGTGKMEPANVNNLLQEFGNLSYHGMRAGKEPIEVELVYDLDESIEEIPIIAEDFSRVIVNLCYNSFDAMREKANMKRETADDYEPKLTIRTDKKNQTVTIEIEDNGPGIPEEIKHKIMQPFFTTKKGTQGTGLGLSITNDIIKAHGGELKVTSQKKTGTLSTIILPALGNKTMKNVQTNITQATDNP